jgi:vacuolar-type H+-ATPase subunit C/Vma6
MTTFPFPTGILHLDKLQEIAGGEWDGLPLSLAGHISDPEEEIDPDIIDVILDGAYLRHLLMLAEELNSTIISEYINDQVLSSLVSILWRALNQDMQMRRFQIYLPPLGKFTNMIDELSDVEKPEEWPSVIDGAIGACVTGALTKPRDEQVSFFELLVTNHLTRLMSAGRLQTAGPERVFTFLTGLNVEMQNLKLVVAGRLNRISRDTLRLKLKDCYV